MDEGMSLCPACGAPVFKGVAFCRKCGVLLSEAGESGREVGDFRASHSPASRRRKLLWIAALLMLLGAGIAFALSQYVSFIKNAYPVSQQQVEPESPASSTARPLSGTTQ